MLSSCASQRKLDLTKNKKKIPFEQIILSQHCTQCVSLSGCRLCVEATDRRPWSVCDHYGSQSGAAVHLGQGILIVIV